MTSGSAARYAMWSGLLAVAFGAFVLLVARRFGSLAVGWGLLGWAITAVTGVVGGTWLAAIHGRSGSRFFGVLAASMGVRLTAALVGGVVAAGQGVEAVWPYVGGLCLGLLPVQVFEVGWFYRMTRRDAEASDDDRDKVN